MHPLLRPVLITLLVCFVVVSSIALVSVYATTPFSYGHEFRREYFAMAPGVLELNHGSFGARPKAVLAAERAYVLQMEQSMGRWFHGGVGYAAVDAARAAVARFVGAVVDNVVLIDNASSAINAVLRSMALAPGDRIVLFELEYPMGMYTSQYVFGAAAVVKVPLPLPTSPQAVMEALTAALDANVGSVRAVLVDHVASTPSLIMPVHEVVALCRARNITVLVDGAHALGQLPLDLEALDADFYVSNGHKWLCSPVGSAMMRVSPRVRNTVHPAIISNYYGQGMVREFLWTGTRDFSAWLAMVDAIAFREKHGGDAQWRAYNNELCASVRTMLSERWATAPIAPAEMMNASLITLALPCSHNRCATLDVDVLQSQLRARNIWSVVFQYHSQWLVRLSCQVYNELSDYIVFADAFDELVPASTHR